MTRSEQDLLKSYRGQRDFARTREPSGADEGTNKTGRLAFVVQKHDATRLHYDFRIEWDGVLKSWAVTRGPSLDPNDKRLAVRVEDHPLEYGDFEGTIPAGEYGGGTVMLWDRGTWEPEHDAGEGLESGHLRMRLRGEKMNGGWALVRMKPRPKDKRENWLLIKEKDAAANADEDLLAKDRSVASHRTMDEIASGGKAPAAGAPAKKKRTKAAAEPSRSPDERETIAGVALSHPDRVVFAEQGITKRELAEYYEAAAPRMLDHAGKRALSLIRCPGGDTKRCFFQQHGSAGFPDAVRHLQLPEKGGRSADHIFVEDAAGLAALVQMNTVEFHIWGSRIDAVERPDRLVFDLDPDPSIGFRAVAEAAAEFRDRLKERGLESFAMVTGGKGVHVVVPLARRQSWEEVGAFAEGFAASAVEAEPKRFLATASKEKRKGLIFIDWLRNARGQTAIAPYSTRSRESAPVATPVSWDELAELQAGNGFRVADVLKRLDSSDPWKDYGAVRQSITKAMLGDASGPGSAPNR